MRISGHPILTFRKGPVVRFTFEGKELEGFAGEPIAAALIAAGVRVLSVSARLKRKRGFFCAVGNCSSCLMTVDGVPNVRACMEPLRAGMRVEMQEGRGRPLWPG